MVTFWSCDLKLQTVAVLSTLFGVVEIPSQNCKQWQFYGHFSVKCVHTAANAGSSIDKALKLQTLAFLEPLLTLKNLDAVSIELSMLVFVWRLFPKSKKWP